MVPVGKSKLMQQVRNPLRHDADLQEGERDHVAGRLQGKTLGVWFAGNEYPFLSWMGKLGLSTSGSNPDVKVLRQGFNVDPLLQNQGGPHLDHDLQRAPGR